ncbi:hypothetical protein V6Z11_A04G162700 [Gossypium hirsutum]
MAITLNNGFQMPIIAIKDLIIESIKIGFRHFDCASDYKNEAEVGEALCEAIKTGLVKREELFITTKARAKWDFDFFFNYLWNTDHGHVVEACKKSLKKLQLDYLDLYLVHFPISIRHTGIGATGSPLDEDGVLDIETNISLETTWHAMEDLVSLGLVRSIGISNYDIFLTRDCLAYSKIKPAVNQIETHPYFQRESLGIAEKYKKTAAQIVLRWGIQRNTLVIPKTSKFERLKENFKVLEFELAKEDMDVIQAIDKNYRSNIQPAKFWGIDLYA